MATSAPWTQIKGFNFRDTVGYVTDPAHTVFVEDNISHPTEKTIDGETVDVGWSSAINGYNINAGIDARLAGLGEGSSSDEQFIVTLPASGGTTFRIRLGLGCEAYGGTNKVEIYDNTTLLTTYESTTTAGQFSDTGGVRASAAAWATAYDANYYEATFASTTLKVKFFWSVGNTRFAHIAVEQVAAASSILPLVAGGTDMARLDDMRG